MGKGARKKSAEKIARYAVTGLQAVYMALGIVVIVAGISIQSSDNLAVQTELMLQQLNLKPVSDILLFCGIATLIIAISGVLGSFLKVRKALTFFLVGMLVVSVMLIASGANLAKKDTASLSNEWFKATQAAQLKREEMEANFGCCGFNVVTDSYVLGAECNITDAEYAVTPPCQQASQDYFEAEIKPKANLALGIGVFELLSLGVTLVLVFTSKEMKEDFYENPFHG